MNRALSQNKSGIRATSGKPRSDTDIYESVGCGVDCGNGMWIWISLHFLGDSVPAAFKLGHLTPFKPILF